PAFHPITAVVTKDGKRVPLVIYRSYWGLHAYDLANKKVAWKTPMDWSIEKLIGTTAHFSAVNSWVDWFSTQAKRPNILFENSPTGTPSSDGAFVFAVDDLAVPMPPSMQAGMEDGLGRPGINPNPNLNDALKGAVLHSKLRAYDLVSGKLKWEVGGRGKEKEELYDSYFLGPPMPMAGKLYCLTEKNQDLRLICLEAATGKLLQVQQLATTRDKLQVDVARRVQAAHLSYGEGMLVCPTNAGAILGIDLLTNSLVWAFSYREKSDAPKDPPVPIQPGVRPRPFPQPQPFDPTRNNHWKVSAPIIQDGKVVFAAP